MKGTLEVYSQVHILIQSSRKNVLIETSDGEKNIERH